MELALKLSALGVAVLHKHWGPIRGNKTNGLIAEPWIFLNVTPAGSALPVETISSEYDKSHA